MRPLPALLVALLFVAATVIPVAGVTQTPERTETVNDTLPSIDVINNTTNQLSIPDDEVRQSNYSEVGVDVGTAIYSGSTRLHERHDALSFEERFRQTDSNAARSQFIDDRLSAVERQQTALDERQDTAMSRYAAGEISAAEFLRVRMVVNAEAVELLSTLESIESAPDTTADYTLSQTRTDRLRSVEGELQALSGPVGTRLQSDITSGEQTPIYLEVASDGYMLATTENADYLRETRLDDERDTSLPDQFLAAAEEDSDTNRFEVADERAAELYGWLYERQRPSFTYYGTSGIYELTATHPNGELVSYIDAGTTNVFYEEQSRDLGGVETTARETGVNESLRVTVHRSVESGPLRVTAENNITGDPVDANVTIDGQRVGSTGSDGSLWTVEPGADYTLNATAAGTRTTVAVTVSPER